MPLHDMCHLVGLLEQTVADPFGPEAAELLTILRATGLKAQRGAIRGHAQRLLRAAQIGGATPSPGVVHLLTRLSSAGLSPSYDIYMAVKILTDHLKLEDATEIRRTVARTIDEIVTDMLGWPELAALPNPELIKQRLGIILETCDRLHHGSHPVVGAPTDVLEYSSLPESPVHTERFFQRTTQAQELIFAACALLTERAGHAIAYGDVGQAGHELRAAAYLLDVLLQTTFRMLQPLTLEAWLQIRPDIEKPSAIQSRNYRTLASNIETLHVNLASHRLEYGAEDWEKGDAERFRELIGVVCAAHEAWHRTHLGMVRKYTPPGDSDGLIWLKARLAALRVRSRCEIHPRRERASRDSEGIRHLG